jgi:hypothetical protein
VAYCASRNLQSAPFIGAGPTARWPEKDRERAPGFHAPALLRLVLSRWRGKSPRGTARSRVRASSGTISSSDDLLVLSPDDGDESMPLGPGGQREGSSWKKGPWWALNGQPSLDSGFTP